MADFKYQFLSVSKLHRGNTYFENGQQLSLSSSFSKSTQNPGGKDLNTGFWESFDIAPSEMQCNDFQDIRKTNKKSKDTRTNEKQL